MEVFRVVRSKYQKDLSGQGAALFGGRWNQLNDSALYTAGSRSLAILETLVHLRRAQPPADYCVMVLYLPDTLPMRLIADRELPADWRTDETYTQQLGSDWLRTRASVTLKIPSVIVRSEYNYLLNPIHPDFQEVQLISIESIEFDSRFFEKM